MSSPSIPSPLERLSRLEKAVEQLVSVNVPAAIRAAGSDQLPKRSIWPSDLPLLTRILRRSPEVLNAYQAPAELSRSNAGEVYLSTSASNSPFHFCELYGGEAVVWVNAGPGDQIRQSELCRSAFATPPDFTSSSKFIFQELAVFLPISRGSTWIMRRRGEVVCQSRLLPEHLEQASLLQRLETLERLVSQANIGIDSALQDLRSQVAVQKTQIDQLLRLGLHQNH